MKIRAAAWGFVGVLVVGGFGLPVFDSRAEVPTSNRTSEPSAKNAKPRKPVKPKAAPARKRGSKLDLSVPDQPDQKSATPENPNYTSSVLRDNESGVEARAAAESAEGTYKTEPLFQSDQKLQILDTEVPVSVKLGRWRTSQDSKALGLSATVPLRDPLR